MSETNIISCPCCDSFNNDGGSCGELCPCNISLQVNATGITADNLLMTCYVIEDLNGYLTPLNGISFPLIYMPVLASPYPCVLYWDFNLGTLRHPGNLSGSTYYLSLNVPNVGENGYIIGETERFLGIGLFNLTCNGSLNSTVDRGFGGGISGHIRHTIDGNPNSFDNFFNVTYIYSNINEFDDGGSTNNYIINGPYICYPFLCEGVINILGGILKLRFTL